MQLIDDLNGLIWVATIVAIVVSCLVIAVDFGDWRDRRKIDAFDGRATLVTVVAIALIAGALNSYEPKANAPRKTVEGTARFVAELQGRDTYHKFICATSCQLTGGYALDLRDKASTAVHMDSRYNFTYLEKPEGGVVNGVSLWVIAVSDPDTGRVLFAEDLTNHPWRIAVYLFDTALVVGAGLLGGLLNRGKRIKRAEVSVGDVENGEERPERPMGDGPISLGLESKDSD
jgi:hypothetical protein